MGKHNKRNAHYQRVQSTSRQAISELGLKLKGLTQRPYRGFSDNKEAVANTPLGDKDAALQCKVELTKNLQKHFIIEKQVLGDYWQDRLSAEEQQILVEKIVTALEEVNNSFARDQYIATMQVQKKVSKQCSNAA